MDLLSSFFKCFLFLHNDYEVTSFYWLLSEIGKYCNFLENRKLLPNLYLTRNLKFWCK